jgi:hypothetical protein
MGRIPCRRFPAITVALLLGVAAPAFARDGGDAILALSDDGALDRSAVHAMRNLAAGQLRKRGIALTEDRRLEGVVPVDEDLVLLASDLGVRRLFVLRVGGRLGQKVPLTFDELSPRTLAPVSSASLTANGLDECDVVMVRLVDAVLDRRGVESTATMTTMTATESKPFGKKPGERFWFVGLPVALYNSGNTPTGFSLGYGYEAENFRISVTGAGFSRGSDGVAYLAMEAAWIPFSTEVSPYLGAAVGYMAAGGHGGLGTVVEGGLEAFRLHGVRGLLGVQLAIPFFDTQETSGVSVIAHRSVYPAGFVRFAF